jgi:hypothetical protein
MADTIVDVLVQIAGEDVPAGRLWGHRHGRGGSATFAYLPEYLAREDSYELDPRLTEHTGRRASRQEPSRGGEVTHGEPAGALEIFPRQVRKVR